MKALRIALMWIVWLALASAWIGAGIASVKAEATAPRRTSG
jgi:hypothetical protein